MKCCALLSVTDKTGLPAFAKELTKVGYELLSTGGTARVLREAGLAVTDVSVFTDLPEMFDGRVKTLHPKIFAGILARREKKEDMDQLARLDWSRIDLAVVNLYNFAAAVKSGADLEAAIEQIDIGGPSILRATAKNFTGPMVICDPADYDEMLPWVRNAFGAPLLVRLKLALKVFEHTAGYDSMIATYLKEQIDKLEHK